MRVDQLESINVENP